MLQCEGADFLDLLFKRVWGGSPRSLSSCDYSTTTLLFTDKMYFLARYLALDHQRKLIRPCKQTNRQYQNMLPNVVFNIWNKPLNRQVGRNQTMSNRPKYIWVGRNHDIAVKQLSFGLLGLV